MQYHAGHHEYPSLFFRIVWGRLWTPSLLDPTVDVCKELLQETSLIVQFHHTTERTDHEPADVQACDDAFKSDGFQLPEHEVVEVWRF
ncbi:hypothetical protein BDV38DRAFT_265559 [Aspergillus pseudotamarii]|uniref:Uncharacterized protein n=1 Tax=Aspergillus pseudotamarii TaxID=132259 RepID=A0A5N6SD41_ASPPS|nr:uncharacterized protein BDV38DRAFT_265559 [Aspergillus pseudotamarii]KAE8131024.1 hypothetical protein BDV38DRAFT_265559 [Aspergillus pseudotamarii]